MELVGKQPGIVGKATRVETADCRAVERIGSLLAIGATVKPC